VDQGVTARCHRQEALARRGGDLFEPCRQHEARQGHLVLVRAARAVGKVGEMADLGGSLLQWLEGVERGLELRPKDG